jgi:excisionase family DNA binding protein
MPVRGALFRGAAAAEQAVARTVGEEQDMSDPQVLRDVLADDALLVTPEEAAALLRVGRTTVYALMKDGDLRPVHIGRSCRLPRSELHRYIEGLSSSRSEQPERVQPGTETGAVSVSVHTLPGGD